MPVAEVVDAGLVFWPTRTPPMYWYTLRTAAPIGRDRPVVNRSQVRAKARSAAWMVMTWPLGSVTWSPATPSEGAARTAYWPAAVTRAEVCALKANLTSAGEYAITQYVPPRALVAWVPQYKPAGTRPPFLSWPTSWCAPITIEANFGWPWS